MRSISKTNHLLNKRFHVRFTALVSVVLAVALLRLLPHPPNFTPVGAIALFGGAYFKPKYWAFLVPIAAMLISDIGLELLSGRGLHALMPVIYSLILATVAIGLLLQKKVSFGRICGAAFGSSLLFFVGSNFAVWVMSTSYPSTVQGLLACYTAAIPFFQNTLGGTLFYSALMFGGWALAEHKFPILGAQTPKALAV